MKKFLSTILAALTLMSTPVYAMEDVETSNCDNYTLEKSEEYFDDTFDEYFLEVVKRMEKIVLALPVSKNINFNFLNEMIALHSEEIQLSMAIQGFTDNSQIIQFSNQVLDAENGEIREMRIVRDDMKVKKDEISEQNSAFTKIYKDLFKERINTLYAYKLTGRPEEDYLNIMIISDEADIDLAENYLKYSTDDVVEKIANNIINIKKSQVEDAKRLLSAIK